MKLLVLIGSPREAISQAPIIRAMQGNPDSFEVSVCVGGKRPAALDAALSTFQIVPNEQLSVSALDGTPAERAARMFEPLDRVVAVEMPDWVVVQGDGSMAAVGSLVAYYRRVQIAHVEAGVRSYDKYSPFPAEMNRRVTDLLADLNFAPTAHCQRNLIDEGFPRKRVPVTGSTAIDALQHALQIDCDLQHTPVSEVSFDRPVLLVAARSEETDLPNEICGALRRIATQYASQVHIVYVKHIDTAAGESVDSILGDLENVTVVPPLDYLPFVHLLNRCQLVLTDSGGVQEEACSLGKPVLLLSNVTERIEALEEGTAKLVGTAETGIVKEVQQLLDDRSAYAAMAQPSKLFGDGRAAAVICHELLHSERRGANVP